VAAAAPRGRRWRWLHEGGGAARHSTWGQRARGGVVAAGSGRGGDAGARGGAAATPRNRRAATIIGRLCVVGASVDLQFR
jgi:hypothetical protein